MQANVRIRLYFLKWHISPDVQRFTILHLSLNSYSQLLISVQISGLLVLVLYNQAGH